MPGAACGPLAGAREDGEAGCQDSGSGAEHKVAEGRVYQQEPHSVLRRQHLHQFAQAAVINHLRQLRGLQLGKCISSQSWSLEDSYQSVAG